MKKLIITAIGGCVLLLSSCKENDLAISYGSTSVDTTYVVSPVPVAQPHNVLIEEFTGQSCSNCPAAHEILTSLEATNPGRINVVGLYMTGFPQNTPPPGAIYDFRDSSATTIAVSIYGGVGAIPTAGIDRQYDAAISSYQIDRSLWSDFINTHLTITDSLNLQVSSSYNADGTATITATITYTQPVATSQSLNIAVVEDSMVDVQEFPPYGTPGGIYPSSYDSAYVFTNVLRDFATSVPNGDVILPAQPLKEAGRVVVKTYSFKPRHILNPARCKVIAYVGYSSSEGAAKDIFQSASTKLTGP